MKIIFNEIEYEFINETPNLDYLIWKERKNDSKKTHGA